MQRKIISLLVAIAFFAPAAIAYAQVMNLNQIVGSPGPYWGVLMGGGGKGTGKATASSSPTVGSINATSTSLTSNFAGQLNIVGTTTLSTTTAASFNSVVWVTGNPYPMTSAGIQNAVNVAHALNPTNATVCIATGTSTITSSIVVPSNVRICGTGWGTVLDGSSFAYASSTVSIFYNNTTIATTTNVMIDHLKIIGRHKDKDTGGNGGQTFYDVGVIAGTFGNIENFTLESVYIQDAYAGFLVGHATTTTDLMSFNSKNIRFINNTAFNSAGGFQTRSILNGYWSGNTCINVVDDCISVLGPAAGGTGIWAKNINIIGNRAYNGTALNSTGNRGRGSLVKLDGTATTRGIQNVTIGDNISDTEFTGIAPWEAQYITIKNNVITNSAHSAIDDISGDTYNVTIEGNHLYQNNTESDASSAGINTVVTGASSDWLVSNNTISAGTSAGDNSIFFRSGTAQRVQITNNDIGITNGTGIKYEGTKGLIFNNRVTGGIDTPAGNTFINNPVDWSSLYAFDVIGSGHFTTFVDASNFVATSSTATSTFPGYIVSGPNGQNNYSATQSIINNTALNAALSIQSNTSLASLGGDLVRIEERNGSDTSNALHVRGTINASTQYALFAENNGTNALASGNSVVFFRNSNTSDNAGGNILKIQPTGTNAASINALITTGGLTGISTTTPVYPLDVFKLGATAIRADGGTGYGQIRITGANGTLALLGGGSGDATNYIESGDTTFAASNDLYLTGYNNNTGSTLLFRFSTTTIPAGKFGIATTTPGSALSVQGNQFIAGNIVSTSTLASIFPYASTTAISASNLSSGNCVQASTGGFLTTTASPCGTGAGSVTSIATTFPIQGGTITTTGTLTFGGLATTSPFTIGQIAYVADSNHITSVATGTVSAGSSAITVTAGRFAIGGALAIDCATASGSQNGCLSSTDWTTFNGKGSGTVTSIIHGTGLSGGTITTSGTTALLSYVATSSAETNGQLAYWGTTNGTPAGLRSVATGTISASLPISVTAGRFAVGGAAAFSIADAVADGATKGASTYTAADFNDASGVISLDYTNAQKASATVPGFMVAGDYQRLYTATTTFSSPLVYTLSTNAVTCPTCATGSFAYPFTTGLSTFGTTTSATSSSIWTMGAFFSTSTVAASQFPYASTTMISATTASSTNLIVSGVKSALILNSATGVAGAFGGSGACTNQFVTVLSAAGVGTCASVADAAFTGTLAANHGGTGQDFSGSTGAISVSSGTFSAGTLSVANGGTAVTSFPISTLLVSGTAGTTIIGTSTPTFGNFNATSTTATSTINANLWVGFAAKTPYLQIGSTTPFVGTGNVSGNLLQAVCNQNGTSGCQIGVQNTSAGTAAYSALYLNNDKADSTVTHFGTIFLNSYGYTDTTFGTGLGVGGLMGVQNTEGTLALLASTSTTNGLISFFTGGTATANERMRITSTGNVGIAQTTPSYTLDVTGNGHFTGIVDAPNFVATSTTATSSLINLFVGRQQSYAVSNAMVHVVNQLNTQTAVEIESNTNAGISTGELLHVENRNASDSGNAVTIKGTVNGASQNSLSVLNNGQAALTTGRAVMQVQNTNATDNVGGILLKLTAAGNNIASIVTLATNNGLAGFGTTTPWGALSVTNAGTSPSFIVEDSASPDTTPFLIDASGNVGIASTSPWRTFDVNGTVSMKGLTASAGLQVGILCLSATNEVINESVACVASSERFKKDIQPLDAGLVELMKLRPVSFYYKPEFNGALQSNPNFNGEQVGFIAEDVIKIDPRLAVVETEGPDIGKPHGVRYEQITALLTKAVQEQQKQIENIKTGAGNAARSAEENWQWIVIGLLALGLFVQQAQIQNLKDKTR